MESHQINDVIAKANAAAKEKNWSEVLELLAPFRDGVQIVPNNTYPLLVCALGKQGFYQDGDKLVAAAPESLRKKLSFLKAAAELYYDAGQHSKSLPFLEAIHRNYETRVGYDASRMYAMALKGLSHSEAEGSRIRSVGKVAEFAGNAYKALEATDLDRAISCFSDAVFELHGDAVFRTNWLDAFRLLCGLDLVSDDAASMQNSSPPIKAFSVSGTGWSGSGAIFDYFSEFSEIRKIGGEFPFIQAKSGVSGLYNQIRKKRLRVNFIDFFKFNIFGFCGAEGFVNQKSIRYSKPLVSGARSVEYSSVARLIMLTLASGDMRSRANLLPALRQVTDIYLRFRANAPPEKSPVIPMFDNIIHAYNLDALRFATNMDLFCSVRDPRSNYVAYKRESISFDSTVERYVEAYRRKRKKIESKYKQFVSEKKRDESLRSQVHFVQFENFVMDREYRQALARKARLDLAQQEEYSRFKPDVSEKNVFLFENYEKQDEIRYIEKELSEYCIDVHALKALGKMT